MYALKFEKSAPLDRLFGDMHDWCEGQLVKLQRKSVADLEARVKNAPKWTDDVVRVNSVTFESNSAIGQLRVGSVSDRVPPSLLEFAAEGILKRAVCSSLSSRLIEAAIINPSKKISKSCGMNLNLRRQS